MSHVVSPTTVSDSGTVAYRTVPVRFGLPTSTMLKSWVVRFGGASAGTCHYVCQIHAGMAGTIVVH